MDETPSGLVVKVIKQTQQHNETPRKLETTKKMVSLRNATSHLLDTFGSLCLYFFDEPKKPMWGLSFLGWLQVSTFHI